MNQLPRALAFLARHWPLVALLCAALVFASTFHACREAGEVEQAVRRDPPLPKKQAQAMIAKSKADAAKAVAAITIARVYHKQADSALAVAKSLTAHADSAHARLHTLPAAARSAAELQRFLATYAGLPDSAGY